MQRLFVYAMFWCAALILAAPAAEAGAASPLTIAGIKIGQNSNEFAARMDKNTALPLWSQPYLTRVKLTPTKGYKSGYVSYGNCAKPGRILRIKMKYENDELKFAQDLAKKLMARFGKPVDFRGNSWGTASAYKWSIPLDKKTSMSLILMHSVSDDESYTKGNSIRIAVPEWIEQEKQCYDEKAPQDKESEPFGPDEPTDEWYLPQ
ncbi:MAG: hypothetical protein PWQ57_2298 [Desulfovibrionales bacterium]|nr:hypothetical protein [Desulfovibrionales bacterium]